MNNAKPIITFGPTKATRIALSLLLDFPVILMILLGYYLNYGVITEDDD